MKKLISILFFVLAYPNFAQANCSVGVLEDEYRFNSPLYQKLKILLEKKNISVDHVSTYSMSNIKNNQTPVLVDDGSGHPVGPHDSH